MSGLSTTYRYFCTTENGWVNDERLISSGPPTKCKNDDVHVIKNDSIHIENGQHGYCKVVPMIGTENNTETLDTSTMTLEQCCRRLLTLEKCALYKGLLREL